MLVKTRVFEGVKPKGRWHVDANTPYIRKCGTICFVSLLHFQRYWVMKTGVASEKDDEFSAHWYNDKLQNIRP